MVIFPEDFGATVIHAFNLPEPDLLAFAEAVAAASAPQWERIPSGLANDAIRVCLEIPPDATNDHAAFGFIDDGRTTYSTFFFFDGSSNTGYRLLLFAGDALDGCPEQVRTAMAWARDPALYDAARAWLATQSGELTGECATRPLILGADESRIDWCYYRPRRETGGDVTLTIQRRPDFTLPMVLRPRDGRYDVVSAVQRDSDDLRLWYFHDDNTMRWTRHAGAAGYRLTATLNAGRELAADPCAEPPLEEELLTIVLDETFTSDVDGFALDLPALPPQDAWYVTIAGTGNDGMIHLHALDASGNVIAETGAGWVRDIFCVRPTRDRAQP
ncbi:MAG: hypothetical protein WEB52_00670 [Dehalococcoidia bacterium]